MVWLVGVGMGATGAEKSDRFKGYLGYQLEDLDVERKVKNDTTEINKDHKKLLPLIVFQGNRQTREMNKFLKSVSLPIRARKKRTHQY